MEESEIDIRGILGLLRRRMVLIVSTTVLVVAVAAAVAFTLTPLYTASALVLVDPSRKNILDDSAISGASSAADNARIDSEVELARSDNVLLKVIQREQLISDDEFGVSIGLTARLLSFLGVPPPDLPTGQEALNQSLSKLRSAVSVQRKGLTYLISLQVRSEEAGKAAGLANALAEVYIQDQLSSKISSAVASLEVIQSRLEQARTGIVASETAYDQFIADNIDAIARDSGRTDLANMQRQIAALESARAQSASLASTVQVAIADNDINAIVTNLQSEALDALEQQRERLRRDLADQAGTASELDLQAELSRIEQSIIETANSEVTALQGEVQQAQDQTASLRQTLRSEVIGSALSADTLTQIFELQQNAELARRQYQTLLSRAQDLEAQADLQLADSRIVSTALAPEAPSFPNKRLILILAGLAGLGLGVGLAFLYENLVGGFTTDEQVATVLKRPVAATVPRQQGKAESDSHADLVVSSPLSIFSESIRRARAAVDQAIRHAQRSTDAEERGRIVLVTSSNPNEGKTTMALAMARSAAMSGQSVLLIDCDLRKPSVHRHLGIAPETGLLDLLQSDEADQMASLRHIIISDPLSRASVVVGSRRSNAPTDQLLDNPSFHRILKAARRSFDYVILDTPPVGPVVDALYLCRQADAITFVIKWASTSQSEVRKNIDALVNAAGEDIPLLVALTQQEQSRSEYYKKYSGYYSYSA
ncbi:Wzz/FepE/Etk N-terminal domain-containing protein [Devosia salina]|uniref:non-specific protein-tyrosine kinase n=1 Tax=Devosia salina TaxID=2860336 RepID=A0ABX8WM33_9HYPH|nr:Wzz/FepE/Etk N-terminal domain-containing protein [Devosia salina]QYO78864.1 AAA family ATPase [Devosia salina]